MTALWTTFALLVTPEEGAYRASSEAERGSLGPRLVSGVEAIKVAVRMILLTTPGERLMSPDFGCRLRELLFKPATAAVGRLAEQYVREALEKWEPRIELQQVQVKFEPGGGRDERLTVALVYRIHGTQEVLSDTLTMEGARG